MTLVQNGPGSIFSLLEGEEKGAICELKGHQVVPSPIRTELSDQGRQTERKGKSVYGGTGT